MSVIFSRTKDKAIDALFLSYLSRFTDQKMLALSRQNKGGNFQLSCLGHELVGIIAGQHLIPERDWLFPYYRDQGVVLSLGCDLTELFAIFLGRSTKNHSSGRMMPYHYSHRKLRICCQSSVVGSQYLQAAGRAWAVKDEGKKEVVYVSGGEGSTSQGDFHEMLNFVSLHHVPLITVVQNNSWAISVPLEEQRKGSLVNFVQSYSGIHTVEVDGNDYERLDNVFSGAIEEARTKYQPTVIIANVVRLDPHSNSDDHSKYKSLNLISNEKAQDPLRFLEEYLLRSHSLSMDDILDLKAKASEDVSKAAKQAEGMPVPQKGSSSHFVFAPYNLSLINYDASLPYKGTGKIMTMRDAISKALEEEMALDSNVVVFGEDVAGDKGGVFGVTRGLTKKFGKNRCFNSSLAESTIIGTAIGMAFDEKYKPVVEIQFADYIWTAANQLFNELSSIYYRSHGEWEMSVVVRMPVGGYIQGGPYHSQSIEGFLAHCPGLKIIFPSNSYDAKALLKTAIRDPNPVLFLEHKALYQNRGFSAQAIGSSEDLLPLGCANIVHEGEDLTLVSWGMTLVMSIELAQSLFKEGISVEVIDLRTIVPCDFSLIINSLKKTGKLLVVHEAPSYCGFGSEIIARVSEEAFSFLDAPIQRVCGLNTPVPYSKVLEQEVLPQKEQISEAIRHLAAY